MAISPIKIFRRGVYAENIQITGAKALEVFFLSFLLEYNEKNNTESFLSSEIIGITLLS